MNNQHLWPPSVEDLVREEYPTPKPIVASSVALNAAPPPAARFGLSCVPTSGFTAGSLTGWVERGGPGSVGQTG